MLCCNGPPIRRRIGASEEGTSPIAHKGPIRHCDWRESALVFETSKVAMRRPLPPPVNGGNGNGGGGGEGGGGEGGGCGGCGGNG